MWPSLKAWLLQCIVCVSTQQAKREGLLHFLVSKTCVHICMQLQASKPEAWHASSCKVDSASVHSSSNLCLSHFQLASLSIVLGIVKTKRLFVLMSLDYRHRVSMETALKGTFKNERSDCEREAKDIACIIALGWTQVLIIMPRKWSWPREWAAR